jgi:hypothetical protein
MSHSNFDWRSILKVDLALTTKKLHSEYNKKRGSYSLVYTVRSILTS